MIKGIAYQLRLIEPKYDSNFIYNLRTDPTLNKFINSTNSKEQHNKWLQEYSRRDNDLYFIIEKALTYEPQGVVSLYNINFNNKDVEMGRWIIKPGSLAATESAYLSYKYAFEVLGLNSVYCKTLTANKRTVNFHNHFGLQTVSGNFIQLVDDIEQPTTFQILSKLSWNLHVKHKILPKVIKIAKRVNR